KVDQLLWFGPTAGMLEDRLGRLSGRTSPAAAYLFDSVFSLSAFDGRPLPRPVYLAIQAQANGARPEWLFGQAPFTEGWMRALIERLKDSVSTQHNSLGERLEEALLDDRFHLGIMRGIVEEGRAVPDTFDVALFPHRERPTLN